MVCKNRRGNKGSDQNFWKTEYVVEFDEVQKSLIFNLNIFKC